MRLTKNIIPLIFMALLFFNTSCEEALEITEAYLEYMENDEDFVYIDLHTGVDENIEQVNYSKVPKELSLVTLKGSLPKNTSEALSLRDWMPPIGDQEAYGTCTSWATGYYTRTISYARENDLTAGDLIDPSLQFSPLDIYLSIDHSENCGGSAPSNAFRTMKERGIARMSDVPYENLGDCSQRSSATSSQYSAGKIDNFRAIDSKDIEALKSYLSLGRPITVSCKLGPEFFQYKAGTVHQDDDYTQWDAEGRHAYHAMTIVGYDDNKGPNGALLLANSWGKVWGDNGFIWVDYDFFTGGVFGRYAYVIESDKGDKPVIDKNIVDVLHRSEGMDALTVKMEEEMADDRFTENPTVRNRMLTYNILNKGKDEIPASKDWNIVYYYYNATDPENDFGILFYDYYTDDVTNTNLGSFGEIGDENTQGMKKYGQNNYWNYVNIPSGYSVGRALNDDSESDMRIYYEVPSNLNGSYYFVLFADGFNAVEEAYEQNNYMFLTGNNAAPLEIKNGEIISTSSNARKTETKVLGCYENQLLDRQPNAYTIDEISTLIDYQKSNGILERLSSSARISGTSKTRKVLIER
ncbi:C1 family peptidase [Flammeovirga aprica]|uniref:C1 family peptidase n=1 Tax=Flammeovirga aprica JL-4 TaxID=694437 RepID=A0A7X9XCK4_9BACT|nr:C1 family peptidase [Flammeovirga aprica]NME71729.1 C1 family peptidase [Flammeovirga aprica JL-4]